ncbi:MAG: hypothetical protein Q8R00_00145 [Candidatus Nanoarchaeia archaeon]|nr:hypothetical protein [Candidatus Nanoarchaeia archaeon]
MTRKIFHGNNWAYLNKLPGSHILPKYWTSSLKDAVDHAERSSKRFSSSMIILVYPNWPEQNFRELPINISGRDTVKWYELDREPFDFLDLEKREEYIEIYEEEDFHKVTKYFTQGELDSLINMKYAQKFLTKEQIRVHRLNLSSF